MGRIEETVLTLTTNGDLDSQNLRMLIRIEFTYAEGRRNKVSFAD